ncbi:MAG: hypothetical protein ACEPOW_00095 [Bacteroidales bacterium]
MKYKAWISLIVTLIIGFVIGFLVAQSIMVKHIHNSRNFTTNSGFVKRYYHVLKPTKEQKKEIYPILNDYGIRFQNLTSDYKQNAKELLDSLEKELIPHLSANQAKKYKHLRKSYLRKRLFNPGRKYRHRNRQNHKENNCYNNQQQGKKQSDTLSPKFLK